MVAGLLDTSYVIDLLRQYPPSLRWLSQKQDLAITRIVWYEIIEGATNKRALMSAIKVLEKFPLVELAVQDMVWATNQLIRFKLSHNVDAFDCLIGSVSYRLQVPLYTHNLKHFSPILGSLAQRPYN